MPQGYIYHGGHRWPAPAFNARVQLGKSQVNRIITCAEGTHSVGVTAGASAPETLVDEVVQSFRDRFDVTVETVETARESVEFKVPRVLREDA